MAEAKIYQSFWKRMKKGNVCYPQDRRPARSIIHWVEERTQRIDESTSRHDFYNPAGEKLGSMIGRCGYDRGPKKYDLICEYLRKMQEGN